MEKKIFCKINFLRLKNWTFSRQLTFASFTNSNILRFQTFVAFSKYREIAKLCFLFKNFTRFLYSTFKNLCRQVIINRQHTLRKSAEVIIFFFCILSDLDRIQTLRDNDSVSEAHLGLCQTSMMDFFYGNS